jgi:hypothetical protein
MAINLPLTDVATREERTWRANIETPVGGNYAIQVYREIVDKDGDGNVLNVTKKAGVVERAAAAIAEESVTLPSGGGTVTAAQILGALPLFFDRWATEDAEAAAAAAVPVVPAPPPGEPDPNLPQMARRSTKPATKRSTKKR